MRYLSPTRRGALKLLGGMFAGSALHLGERDSRADHSPNGDAVIDTHLHIVSSRLARGSTKSLPAPFDVLQQPNGAERLAKIIEAELKASNVAQALCMPSTEISDDDPLGIQRTLEQARLIEGVKLHPIGVAHPERFDRGHLERVEDVLKQGQVKAFKAYLGYMHYEPANVGYRPYYRLAAKYNIPVIYHTGDTYSRRAKVKFAHPLAIDEIAVDFPSTKFVLAHFGNPWVMDAAQVIYKNKNVWADLSAFLIGDADELAEMKSSGVWERTAKRVKEAIEYAEADDRFVFGSDWPLAPIATYRDFVRDLFPKERYRAVFYDNAKALYGL
ncbi:MAG TPA: amidohydrolase family protein [Pirellulales bacterium]|nr:amidohydrolase family protein [Pirellulales bacterium]